MASTPITSPLTAYDRDLARLSVVGRRACVGGALTVVAACIVVIGIAELLASSGRALGWTLLVVGCCLELSAALPLLVRSVLTLTAGEDEGPRLHMQLLVR